LAETRDANLCTAGEQVYGLGSILLKGSLPRLVGHGPARRGLKSYQNATHMLHFVSPRDIGIVTYFTTYFCGRPYI